MQERAGYSRVQIILHWLIAALIVINWFLGESAEEVMEKVKEGAADPGFSPHMPIGLAILALVVLRIGIKLVRGGPMPPGAPGSLPVRAALAGHALIYLLMVAVPLGGAMVFFMGLGQLGGLHGLAANLLMVLALGHAVLALVHQYILKDRLMLRMMRPE